MIGHPVAIKDPFSDSIEGPAGRQSTLSLRRSTRDDRPLSCHVGQCVLIKCQRPLRGALASGLVGVGNYLLPFPLWYWADEAANTPYTHSDPCFPIQTPCGRAWCALPGSP